MPAFWAKIHLHNKKLTRDKASLEITFVPSRVRFLQEVQVQKKLLEQLKGKDQSEKQSEKESEDKSSTSKDSPSNQDAALMKTPSDNNEEESSGS